MNETERHALSLLDPREIIIAQQIHYKRPASDKLIRMPGCFLFINRAFWADKPEFQSDIAGQISKKVWYGITALLPGSEAGVEAVLRSANWRQFSIPTSGAQYTIHEAHIYAALEAGLQQ